jgi:cell shape-determining protein MreC
VQDGQEKWQMIPENTQLKNQMTCSKYRQKEKTLSYEDNSRTSSVEKLKRSLTVRRSCSFVMNRNVSPLENTKKLLLSDIFPCTEEKL